MIAGIGDGVAIVLGATEPPGEMPFRQNSQCFYLSGVVEPRAVLIADGRTKRTTVFLQPANTRRDTSMFGPALAPGPETARELGVDDVRPVAEFTAAVTALAGERRTIYTPFAAEVLGSQSQGDPSRMWKANRDDPWDGRDSREATFVARLKAMAPSLEIRDLDPIVNALRAVKSRREIALIREATRIAGAGIVAAMRATRPGRREYELQAEADYVFKKNGALGVAYFALVATGRTRTTRTITAAPTCCGTVSWSSSTTRRITSTTSPTSPASFPSTAASRRVSARHLRHLPEALSGPADVDRGPQDAGRGDRDRRRQDGRDHGRVSLHRRAHQGCRREDGRGPAHPQESAWPGP